MRHTYRILSILALCAVTAVIWADSRKKQPSKAGPWNRIAAITRPTGAELPDGESLLAAARSRLLAHQSVSAQVRQRVQLFDRQLFGSGIYEQLAAVARPGALPDLGAEQGRASRPLFRFELDFQLEDRRRGFIQSSNGTTLWLYNNRGDEAQLQKVDLDRLTVALGEHGQDVPLGGLPRLLADLDENFEFRTLGESKIKNISIDETRIADIDVWVVQGVWRKGRARRLSKNQDEGNSSASPGIASFEPQVPHDVLLFIDREQLFPYRIRYRRLELAKGDESSQPRTLVEMELFKVRFDEPVNRSLFDKPVNMQATDHTEAMSLRLAKRNSHRDENAASRRNAESPR